MPPGITFFALNQYFCPEFKFISESQNVGNCGGAASGIISGVGTGILIGTQTNSVGAGFGYGFLVGLLGSVGYSALCMGGCLVTMLSINCCYQTAVFYKHNNEIRVKLLPYGDTETTLDDLDNTPQPQQMTK